MNSSRCAACKHLRRRCPSDCIFAPYFPSNNPRRFAYVHKIYGASNVGKILQDVAVECRGEAAETLWYEAMCRMKDPVYGIAGIVSALHQELNVAHSQLAPIKAHIATHRHHLITDNNQSTTTTTTTTTTTATSLELDHLYEQQVVMENNSTSSFGPTYYTPTPVAAAAAWFD